MGYDYNRRMGEFMKVKRIYKQEDEGVSNKKNDVEELSESTKRNNQLRSDSGNIEFSDKLASFFYLLMRDYLPAGKVEGIVREVAAEPEVCLYSNGFLAQYALNLSEYMKGIRNNSLAKALESAFGGKAETEPTESKKKPINMTVDDLEKVADKINKAIENMTEEEKKDWEERQERALDEIVKEEPSTAPRVEEVKKTIGADMVSKYRDDLHNSMKALDDLKKLVPTESIDQIVNILKNEIDEELTDEAKEDLRTRESILKERSGEIKEHTSGSLSTEEAIDLVEEITDDDIVEEKENAVSRGNLKDVREGRALPDALDQVFDEIMIKD